MNIAIESLIYPVIIGLNITYLYFWLVVLYARHHKHIDRSPVTNAELKTDVPFVIQITTKGGSLKVVQRGIRYALLAVNKYPNLRSILFIEVITEAAAEKTAIQDMFAQAVIPITVYVLPPGYQTPNDTGLKARALHYMVEQHRKNPRGGYIVHYDEESVFTPDNLARLVRNLLRNPVGISEGTISYPLEWRDAHVMCRTMESNRPFGCHECYLMMTHPVPLHLHGSNLVIREEIENELGWDLGRCQGSVLVAEDMVFGLMAYLRFGKGVFGWHHVEMLEQPPFTLSAAYKQRERWVMGALQGVDVVRRLPGWKELSWHDRIKVQLGIRFRVFTYAIGLPVSIISLSTWVLLFMASSFDWAIGEPLHVKLSLLAAPGLIMWLSSNQIGLAQNLRHTTMSRKARFLEHINVLLHTPFAGLFDTAGPFVSVVKWGIGKRGVKWNPTPKLTVQQLEREGAV